MGMYNKVELCGLNTAALPVLTEEEKRSLLVRARAGDRQAREQMVEGNLRLVLSVVQRFAQRAHQGHRQLRPRPAGAVLHLWRADDHRRDPALPAR